MKSIKSTNSACLVAIIFCFAVMSMSSPTAADDYTDLMKLIADSEDVRIDAQDLAFLLVTHGFNAEAKGDSVIVKLDDVVYEMTPNGVEPGLADILIEDSKPQVKAPPSAPELHNG